MLIGKKAGWAVHACHSLSWPAACADNGLVWILKEAPTPLLWNFAVGAPKYMVRILGEPHAFFNFWGLFCLYTGVIWESLADSNDDSLIVKKTVGPGSLTASHPPTVLKRPGGSYTETIWAVPNLHLCMYKWHNLTILQSIYLSCLYSSLTLC